MAFRPNAGCLPRGQEELLRLSLVPIRLLGVDAGGQMELEIQNVQFKHANHTMQYNSVFFCTVLSLTDHMHYNMYIHTYINTYMYMPCTRM